jgi:hypothetical protein
VLIPKEDGFHFEHWLNPQFWGGGEGGEADENGSAGR